MVSEIAKQCSAAGNLTGQPFNYNKEYMARMQRIMLLTRQNEWLATFTAVGTGGGTAFGMSTQAIDAAVGIIGATCAVVSTIAAIYFHRKNARINAMRLEDEREERRAHKNN